MDPFCLVLQGFTLENKVVSLSVLYKLSRFSNIPILTGKLGKKNVQSAFPITSVLY